MNQLDSADTFSNWVLYEDNHLLIINKPAGMATQPSQEHPQNTLLQRAKIYVKEKYNKPGEVFLEAIHRLDLPTSGIVLFARTSKGLSRLNQSLRDKLYHKVYCCITKGVPTPTVATLEDWLVHGDYEAVIATKNTPEAKLALLTYHLLKEAEGHALLQVELDTGRYHQIRAQLAHAGWPILGDFKYFPSAKKELFSPSEIALHHYSLTFPHPVTHEEVSFIAPLPSSPIWTIQL